MIRCAILHNAATNQTNNADNEDFAMLNRFPIDLEKKISCIINISELITIFAKKTKNRKDRELYSFQCWNLPVMFWTLCGIVK